MKLFDEADKHLAEYGILPDSEIAEMNFSERAEYFYGFCDMSLSGGEEDEILTECDKGDYTKAVIYLYRVWNKVVFFSSFYTRYGEYMMYCTDVSPDVLYRCASYLDRAKKKELAERAWLLFFLTWNPEEPLDEDYFPSMEKHFNVVAKTAYPDWCCLYPRALHLICEYLISKERYTTALRYYHKITKLNYNGRQSYGPFAYIESAYLRVADFYENGWGVQKNEAKAAYYRRKSKRF